MATQTLFRLSLVCGIAAFLLMFLAFASPFWYKSWTRVHSPFSNVGLWHICLAGFIQPGDPVMKSYVGCWWIHSSEFSRVSDSLQPSWFRGIQALSIFTILLDLVGMIFLILYIPSGCYRKLYNGRRVKILFIDSIIFLASAFLVFLIALVFAEMCNDEDWMPRPWMNYLSWGYGSCVLSGFLAAFTGMFTFVMALIFKDKQRRGDLDDMDARKPVDRKKELEATQAMPAPSSGSQSREDIAMSRSNYGDKPQPGYYGYKPQPGYYGGRAPPVYYGEKPHSYDDRSRGSYDTRSKGSHDDRIRRFDDMPVRRSRTEEIPGGYRSGSESSFITGSKVGESVL